MERVDSRAAESYPSRGRRARVRLHRRLRRLSRRLPRRRSRRRSGASSSREYPSAGSASSPQVAPSSDELIYSHHERGFALLSLRSPQLSPLLRPGRARRGHRGLAGRADLGRAQRAATALDGWALGKGRSWRRGSPGCAATSAADAARAALPGRRRRAHRSAHRRQGAQPRDPRRARCSARRSSGSSSGDRSGLDGYSDTCLRRVWRARAVLVVDDLDAAPAARRRRVRASSCSSRSSAIRSARPPPRRRSPRTTSGCRLMAGRRRSAARSNGGATPSTSLRSSPDTRFGPGRSTTAATARARRRAPDRPLVPQPEELTTGPRVRRGGLGPNDADLTRQHAGEPLGERIVVTGRVLDEDGRPVRGHARRDLAGERRRPLPPRGRPARGAARPELLRRRPLPHRRRGPLPVLDDQARRVSVGEPPERLAARPHPLLALRSRCSRSGS